MSGYIVVKKGAEGIYEEKKSRFIAMTYKIETEETAAEILEQVRKKYWDARHVCHAFVLGTNNEITRCSDDGEPSGTAGKPILDVILRTGVHNCLITVTRYFGGTLLGTGGLVRAYTGAACESLRNSSLSLLKQGEEYKIITDYNGLGKLQHIIPGFGGKITGSQYTDVAELTVETEKEKSRALLDAINESTGGRALITKISEGFIASDYSSD